MQIESYIVLILLDEVFFFHGLIGLEPIKRQMWEP